MANGAKLIYTNPDANCLVNGGIKPGCGMYLFLVSLCLGAFNACIEMASGKKGFYVGKPSSLMMKYVSLALQTRIFRYAQQILNTPEEKTCIIGDNMRTDILAGVLSEIDSVLVLTGVTALESLKDYSYSPYLILPGAGYLSLVDSKEQSDSM